MRTLIAAAALLCLPQFSPPAAAAETASKAALRELDSIPAMKVEESRVTFEMNGQTVVGTLAVPDVGKPAAVILLFHGFTGVRDEMPLAVVKEGVFARSARLWATKGYASLRIDFRGSGESGGKWEDTTFDGQIEDGKAAIRFLKGEKRVDGTRIAVVGWSQGGLVATAVARATPDLRAVALWNPVTNPPLTYTAIFGAQTMTKGLAAGDKPVEATILGTDKTVLRGPFYQGAYAIDPVAELAGYKGPLFLAIGSKDVLVAPEPQMAELLMKYHDGPEELWLRDMNHDFSGLETPRFVDEMAPATLAFLRGHLD